MKLDIKLSCIAQPKEHTLNIADNTYVLFKQDVRRTFAHTTCDAELADGLYSMVVSYDKAVSTSYIYVNNGTVISVDVPAYILHHRPTEEVLDCVDDLSVEVIDLVHKVTCVRPYTRSLGSTLEDMELMDSLYSVAVLKGNTDVVTTVNACIMRIQSGNINYLALTRLQ